MAAARWLPAPLRRVPQGAARASTRAGVPHRAFAVFARPGSAARPSATAAAVTSASTASPAQAAAALGASEAAPRKRLRMKRGHDVNPRGVLREVEQEEIRRLRAKQEQVDHFKPGDHIAVKLYAEALGKPKLKVVSGICIRRHNNGLGSTFTLRTFSEHKSIEFTYPLFSPWLIAIKLLKKGDVRLAQAYYLRSLEENAYLTRVPDDFLELSPELKAKYEQEKVAAAAAAAARDPTIKAAAAPTTSGGGGASAGKAAAAPKQDKKK